MRRVHFMADDDARERSASVTAAGAPDPATSEAAVQTRSFVKARAARASSILEDYSELIADLLRASGEARISDIARAFGVAHPTAVKAVARLKREGLAVSRPYRGIFLTEAGLAMAERMRSRHRLVVEVLTAIGVPAVAAELDADGIEHHLSDETIAAFERYLQNGETPSPSGGAAQATRTP